MRIDSETDVQALVEKIETEGDQESTNPASNAMSFAKVWSAQKNVLDEISDEGNQVADDSWAMTLQKIAAEQSRSQTQEKSGRGVRRKAAQAKVKADIYSLFLR